MKTISLVALAMAFAMPVLAQAPSAKPAAPSAAMSSASAQGKLVDINSASESELDALPGVGKARADAIIKHRPYSGKDDLLSRHVLTKSVYDGIKDKVVARQK
ncbi:MAG: helix-hairpin-helix domain-containing protein [Acetobacteraceae bacterium]